MGLRSATRIRIIRQQTTLSAPPMNSSATSVKEKQSIDFPRSAELPPGSIAMINELYREGLEGRSETPVSLEILRTFSVEEAQYANSRATSAALRATVDQDIISRLEKTLLRVERKVRLAPAKTRTLLTSGGPGKPEVFTKTIGDFHMFLHRNTRDGWMLEISRTGRNPQLAMLNVFDTGREVYGSYNIQHAKFRTAINGKLVTLLGIGILEDPSLLEKLLLLGEWS